MPFLDDLPISGEAIDPVLDELGLNIGADADPTGGLMPISLLPMQSEIPLRTMPEMKIDPSTIFPGYGGRDVVVESTAAPSEGDSKTLLYVGGALLAAAAIAYAVSR